MKLVQCKKKHYYDADKFASCPHCAVYDMEASDTGSRPVDNQVDTEAAAALEEGLARSVQAAMKKRRS